MINVVIKKNKEGIPYYFETSGHAMFADPGKDIVCSAVSVLMITLANSMELNTKDKVEIDEDELNDVYEHFLNILYEDNDEE